MQIQAISKDNHNLSFILLYRNKFDRVKHIPFKSMPELYAYAKTMPKTDRFIAAYVNLEVDLEKIMQ